MIPDLSTMLFKGYFGKRSNTDIKYNADDRKMQELRLVESLASCGFWRQWPVIYLKSSFL